MIFCKKCGTVLPDDARYCTHCGEPTAAAHSDGTGANPAAGAGFYNGNPGNGNPGAGQDPRSNPAGTGYAPGGASGNGQGNYQNQSGAGYSSYPPGGAPGGQSCGGGYAPGGFSYGTSPNGMPPSGGYAPGGYPPPGNRPLRKLDEGQLVFAIVNMILGLIFGLGIMAVVAIWPLIHAVNAQKAASEAEAEYLVQRAKRANIIVLVLNLFFPVLFILFIVLVTLGIIGAFL